ncbi:hypothetical protein LCGC14_0124050 [marine sediment metagenome]|uniref:Pectate lyase domain-containing protein n=1 Tax=marine sediment metagenome TaxID=412755 RepID=A0A0F9V5V4_9ZZZZ|nr:hypothetical protein [Phycisphaerae bacterium]HDZ42306.1 hypothetical protein [Phycisphaerae bacterium]
MVIISKIPRIIAAVLCCGVIILALSGCGTEDRSLRAFPTAEGYGAYAKGGRGGRVIPVTNIEDFDPETEAVIPGSFRAACMAEGPRIIVFRVSGTVELKALLRIDEPYCTIAGQTAPGDGICIRGDHFVIHNTHDIVIRHVRFRCGREPEDGYKPDTVEIRGGRNVIIDHCSVTWGVDECLSIVSDSSRDITVQWSIIAEGLNRTPLPRGPHSSKGLMIAYGASRVSAHHNLIAHNGDRNPNLPAEGELPFIVDVRNNLVYDWGFATAVSYVKTNHNGRLNFIGNRYIPGPSMTGRVQPCLILGVPTQVFLRDNLGAIRTQSSDPESMAMVGAGRQVDEEFDCPPVVTHAAKDLHTFVLPYVGATLPRRDSADARLVQEVHDRTGTIISHPRQVGGWPELRSVAPPADADTDGMPDAWEKTHGFDPNIAADGNADADKDGYTNVEEYLNDTDPRKPEATGQHPAQPDAARAGGSTPQLYDGSRDIERDAVLAEPPVFGIPVVTGITIDGDDSDWGDRGLWVPFMRPLGPKSPEDFDPAFRLGWTEDGLLIAGVVVDDDVGEATDPTRLWEGQTDGIGLYVIGQRGVSAMLRAVISPGMAREHTDAQIVAKFLEEGQAAVEVEGIVAKGVRTESGYTFEVFVPWEAARIDAAVGKELGVQVFIGDLDSDGWMAALWHPLAGTLSNTRKSHRVRLSETIEQPFKATAQGYYEDLTRVRVNIFAVKELAGKTVQVADGYDVLTETRLTEDSGRVSGQVVLPMPPRGETYGLLFLCVDDEIVGELQLPDASDARNE